MNVLAPFLAVSVALGSAAVAWTAELKVGAAKMQAAPGQDVAVPITVKGAKGLNGMQMGLTYDPKVLVIKSVERGPVMPENSIVDHNKEDAGQLGLAVLGGTNEARTGLDSVDKDGAVLTIHFKVVGNAGDKSPLRLTNVRAADVKGLWMLVTTEDGEVAVEEARNVAGIQELPWLYIGIGAAVLLILVVVVLVSRSRKSQT
jgi:hypothetical protein